MMFVEFKEVLRDAIPIEAKTLTALKVGSEQQKISLFLLGVTAAELLLEAYHRSKTKFIVVHAQWIEAGVVGCFTIPASLYVEKVLMECPLFNNPQNSVRSYLDKLSIESEEVVRLKFPVIAESLRRRKENNYHTER